MKKYLSKIVLAGLLLVISFVFLSQQVNAEVTPTITAITPPAVSVGQEFDIIGSGFGNKIVSSFTTNDGSIVVGVSVITGTNTGLQILSWSDTKVRVIFPSGGHNGQISVTVGSVQNYNRVFSNAFPVNIACISDSWQYNGDGWGICSADGIQTATATKIYDCPLVDTPPPATSQNCTPPPVACTADTWSCGDFGACSASGNQTRSCTKTYDCLAVITPSPSTSQSCTPPPSAFYVCYPNCDARVCVNDSCNQLGYMKAATGDKISIVNRDLKLAKKITIGGSSIDSWNLKDDILEFFLPDNIKTGGVFVNVYHSDGNLIAGGTLTIYSKSTLPPPPSCTADTWTCDGWNSCSLSGIQSRICRKTFDCPNAQTPSPSTDQYCEAPSRPTQQVPQDSSQIANQDTIIKATVKLICPLDKSRASQGSGTVIDSNGTILTNKHVVNGTLGCLVGFINDFSDEPYFGDRQIADISKMSLNEDVAILKLRNPQNRTLPYIGITKSSSNIRLGTNINIYGYPAKFGTNMTYTNGSFSGTSGSYLKTGAIIEHGNSGGGAYLNDGTFIGVPSAVIKGELNALGFILSINTINGWLGNSSIAYSNNSNNNFSRAASVLENIDLKKLGSLQLVILNEKGVSDTAPVVVSPKATQTPKPLPPQPNETQRKEAPKTETIITSPKQEVGGDKNSVAPANIQSPRPSVLERFFHWISNLF